MFGTTKQVDSNIMAERLPAVLVSGLVVGAGVRGLRFGYVIATILVFAAGVFIGWLFSS